MSDNDVVKALECCAEGGYCGDCGYDIKSAKCIAKIMKDSILKPCPFCGGKAILGIWRDEYKRLNLSAVHCSVCHVETRVYPRKREAIEAWNRRTNEE